MKKLLICFYFIIPSVGFCCPLLEGTWTSSLQKFESFNKKWANIDKKAWSFMIQTQGQEVIEFNNSNEMLISTPEIEIKMREKTIKLPKTTEKIKFNILGCTNQSIVLKYDRYGQAQITQLHFDDSSTYWEYMGVSGSDGNSHIREYFTKTK